MTPRKDKEDEGAGKVKKEVRRRPQVREEEVMEEDEEGWTRVGPKRVVEMTLAVSGRGFVWEGSHDGGRSLGG